MKQKSRAIYVLFEVKRHTAGGLGKEPPAVCLSGRIRRRAVESKYF